MAESNRTTNPSAPRIVYTSPCGRVKVERHDRRDFLALIDGQPCGFFEFAFQAEHAGHEALRESLEDEAVVIVDEEAEEASYTAPVVDRFAGATVELHPDGTLWASIGTQDVKLTREQALAIYLAYCRPDFRKMLNRALQDHIIANGSPAAQAAIAIANTAFSNN